MVLIATNVFGQNTAAIAATEAQYAEMWAQDAAAMYGYAGSSAAAASLAPFRPPPHTTSQAGTSGQAAAVAHAASTASGTQTPQPLTSVPDALQSLAVPSAAAAAAPTDPLFTPTELFYTGLTSFINGTIGPLSPIKLFNPFGSFDDLGVQSFLAPFNNFNMQVAYGSALGKTATAAAAPLGAASSAAPAVSAEMGTATMAGGLSVPQGWAGAAPALKSLATALP